MLQQHLPLLALFLRWHCLPGLCDDVCRPTTTNQQTKLKCRNQQYLQASEHSSLSALPMQPLQPTKMFLVGPSLKVEATAPMASCKSQRKPSSTPQSAKIMRQETLHSLRCLHCCSICHVLCFRLQFCKEAKNSGGRGDGSRKNRSDPKPASKNMAIATNSMF